MLKQKAIHTSVPTKICPGCGCHLENHGWRNCPRCHHELAGCSGCGNCRCGK